MDNKHLDSLLEKANEQRAIFLAQIEKVSKLSHIQEYTNIPKPRGLFRKRCPVDDSILEVIIVEYSSWFNNYKSKIYYCPNCDYEYVK